MSKGFSNIFLEKFFSALFATLFVPTEAFEISQHLDLAAGRVMVRFDQSNLIIHHNGKAWNRTNSVPKMTVVDHWGDLRKEVENIFLELYGADKVRIMYIEEEARAEHNSYITAALAVNVFIAKMILIGDCELEIDVCGEFAWFRIIRPIGGRMSISASMVIYP